MIDVFLALYVIYRWAEAFFEVFTTVLAGYFMVLMGLVDKESALRVISGSL